LIFLFLINFSTIAIAGNGSAIFPHWRIYSSGGHFTTSSIMVSNISDSDATETVILYDQDGNIFQDDGSDNTGYIWVDNHDGNYNDNFLGGAVTYTLSNHSTSDIYIRPDTTIKMQGYGVIKWSSSTENIVSLIAIGFENDVQTDTDTKSKARYSIEINNGMPF
ncbi:MAG: hypothetical protein MI799_10655, partial [Desulfobacterales bacterium]|nr:hypothetical protein [Desulfobacterales bacterium]